MNTKNNFFAAYAGVALSEKHGHSHDFWPEGKNFALIQGFLGDSFLQVQFYEECPDLKYLPPGYTVIDKKWLVDNLTGQVPE